jgi:hypothetical protein
MFEKRQIFVLSAQKSIMIVDSALKGNAQIFGLAAPLRVASSGMKNIRRASLPKVPSVNQ